MAVLPLEAGCIAFQCRL